MLCFEPRFSPRGQDPQAAGNTWSGAERMITPAGVNLVNRASRLV